jgi:transcriptional regulator with XRE-family HTH domain
MVAANLLRAEMAKAGMTQASLAKEIGVSPQTLSKRLKKGVLGSDEIERILNVLPIEDPMSVFFAKKVS